jgi:hypothetical protein
METKPQYKILQGRSSRDPLILIKFDGQYSYWGWASKKWIHDPAILKRYCADANFQPIAEWDVHYIIKNGHHPSWIIDV